MQNRPLSLMLNAGHAVDHMFLLIFATAVTSIAGEFGSRNITCNCIAPGYFMTEINTALLAKPGFAQTVSNRTTVGRWGEPAEMAGAIVFLASEASAYVNGHVLLVDGGITAAYVSPPGV